MKKILIIVGIILTLSVGGMWVYLLMYGAPENVGDVFARFGGGDVVDTPLGDQPSTVDVGTTDTPSTYAALRQLTTRPVAGAVFTEHGLRYVERGTGHIYDINLESGEEVKVSVTTIPQTVDAVFSPQGDVVAVTSEESEIHTVSVATIGGEGEALDGVLLPSGAREIAFNSTGDRVYYHLKNENGSGGYAYVLKTGKSETLFEIPLRDVEVLWGTPVYVYTTPSAAQKGYAYKVEKNILKPVGHGDYGLMAIRVGGTLLLTSSKSGALVTYTYPTNTQLVTPLFNDKCASAELSSMTYCAAPVAPRGSDIDAWYKGLVSFSDTLHRINLPDGATTTTTLLSDFLVDSGREIDVARIGTNETGTRIYFINKNDSALWMYDTTGGKGV